MAKSDPFGIFAKPLQTVQTRDLIPFLKQWVTADCAGIVAGVPVKMNGEKSLQTEKVEILIQSIQKEFPETKIFIEDERMTSKQAVQELIKMGMKKKDRQKKGNVDEVAASLILQQFLDSRQT